MHIDERKIVAFDLDEQSFGLYLDQVDRVIRAAAITAFPDAPPIVLGILDIHGTLMPVFNMRRRFGRPERPLRPEDEMIVARNGARLVVLPADRVRGVVTHPAASILEAAKSLPRSGVVEGIVQLEKGLLLIHNLDQFLTPLEGAGLESAMTALGAGGGHG